MEEITKDPENEIEGPYTIGDFISINPMSTFWTILFLISALQAVVQINQPYDSRQLIAGLIELTIYFVVVCWIGIDRMTEIVDDSPVLYFFALSLLGGLADSGPVISIVFKQ